MNNEVVKALLDANIYPNGNEEVTAVMVNDVITAVISHFGSGYVFGGVVTPSSSPNENTDVITFYLATQSGTYVNFDDIVVDEILVLITFNGTFTKTVLIEASTEVSIVQETGQSTTSVMSQKATTDAITEKTTDIYALTKFSTGFENPLDVILTGNPTTRKVTITGDCDAYWRGVKVDAIISGYESSAHGTDTTKKYYLYYNGTSIAWSEIFWTFDMLQIAIAYYDNEANEWVYVRECHGLVLDPDAHKNLHFNIGTYKESGGTIAGYTLDSTTASNRRQTISYTYINDEDLTTLVNALRTNSYTRFRINRSTSA